MAAVVLASGCGQHTSRRAHPIRRPSASPSTGDQVVVHVPTGHSRVGVVVLHSYGHGISEAVAQGWNATADRHHFIAIYLSRGPDWNAGLCCGAAAATRRDDVGWLTEQIHRIEARYELTTVYLTGNSNGAMMVERLVSERPRLSGRFAVWAGAPEMPFVSSWNGHGYLYSGKADTTVPIRGGTVTIGGQPMLIDPAARTRRCFPDAHLFTVRLPGIGHAPPPHWPELAWQSLTSNRDAAAGAAMKPCV